MEEFLKYLELNQERLKVYYLAERGDVTLDDNSADMLYVAINPTMLSVGVEAQSSAMRLVVIRNEERAANGVNISIEAGARLDLLELMCNFSKSDLTIAQSADSYLNSTLFQLSNTEIEYTVDLTERGAETEINMLQLPTANEVAKCQLKISHLSPNCTSRSFSKCVASGASTGEFHGLVYVAEGAQQTISEQSSRNIALSREAKIIAEPQLEIYADDVKCTHGATVGQMDKDAILYMRQRGLSEDQARKVQLDGFVADVTMACAIEELREPLVELVQERLYKL